MQEADKVLKKSPNQLCFKALKALALLRMGRDDEADVLVEQIAAENPSDDSTLQVMTFCYKEREECTYNSTFSFTVFRFIFIDEFLVDLQSVKFVRCTAMQPNRVLGARTSYHICSYRTFV